MDTTEPVAAAPVIADAPSEDTKQVDLATLADIVQAYADQHGLTLIEAYAVLLAADGAKSTAENDFNEDGVFDGQPAPDHEVACDLAQRIADLIRDNPTVILTLVPE
jgi:hypothetical protein